MDTQEHGGGRRRGGHRHSSYLQPGGTHNTHNTQYGDTAMVDYQNQNGQGKRGKNNNRGEHTQYNNSSSNNSRSRNRNSNSNSNTPSLQGVFRSNGHQHRNRQQAHGGSWYSSPNSTRCTGNGNDSGSRHGYSRNNSWPYGLPNRISSTQQERTKKTQPAAFGSVASRSFNSTSTTPATAATAMKEYSPFSHGHPTITEREAIRRFVDTNYAGIQENNPNLGYLVELCLSSPSKDLHQAIRTCDFSGLMQCKDMDKICGEIFHYYIGISQCRGGHGRMGDDVVMCDCDGRMPRCFTVAFISMLRDYLVMKKSLAGIYEVLDSVTAGTFPAVLTRPVVESVFPAVPAVLVAQSDNEDFDMCIG